MSVFVGRERELAELRAGLDAAFEGNGAFIVLAGEPGIGKTRLANEFGREAVERGARVLRGGNFEGGGAPPYWPWVQVLRASLTEPLRTPTSSADPADDRQSLLEFRELLPEVAVSDGLEPDLARFRLFDSVANVLQAQWKIQPLVIFLDDLQWADESSLLLLQFLGRDLAGTRMVLLGAYRDIEAHHRPEIGQRIAALACDARTVALGGLAEPEVVSLIQQRTSRSIPEEIGPAVHRATAGNPLFVDELVRSLVAQGGLDASISAVRLPLPDRVRAVIRRRISRLSEVCRRVLAVGAVIGRDFDLAAVAHACAGRDERPLESIDEASTAQIVSSSGGRCGFTHDLYREVIYDDLAPGERRSLHGAVGAALERLYAADIELHLAELAHHFRQALPGSERAIQYSVRAAQRAARQLGFEEAAGHCQAALEGLSASDTPDPVRRCEILLLLGENLWKMSEWKMSEFDRSRQVYAEAAELAEALGLPEMQARAALGVGGHDISFDRADVEPRLVHLLERALVAIGPEDSLLRAELMARLSGALAFSARERARGERLGREAVEMARRLGHKETLHSALLGCICATWGPDNLEERLAISRELTALSEGIGAARNLSLVSHFEEAGDATGARRHMETHDQGVQGARRHLTTTWILTVWRAMSALVQGRFEEAEALSSEALQLRAGTCSPNAVQYYGAQLIALRREQGRLTEVVNAIGGFTNPVLPIWRLALAWVYAELDRRAEAERELEQLGAPDFSEIPRDMYWLPCMWILAEVVAKLADCRRAATVYEMLRPYGGRCAIVAMAFNGGSLERSLGLLAATASRYEEATDHFEAAIVANERIGARPWVAHAEHEYARMLLARNRASDRAHARHLLGRAVDTARVLEMTALCTRAAPLLAELVPASEDEALFRREGEYWTVGFGGNTGRVRDARGLHLISLLLCAPGRDIPAAQLAVWPEVPASPGTNARDLARELGLGNLSDGDGAQPDARARAEYRARLEALRDEADEADRFNDPLRASRAREEITAIAEELGQRPAYARFRKDSERARLAVTKAIRYAIRKVERVHPRLGGILGATVKTGTFCRYEPDPHRPIRWTL